MDEAFARNYPEVSRTFRPHEKCQGVLNFREGCSEQAQCVRFFNSPVQILFGSMK